MTTSMLSDKAALTRLGNQLRLINQSFYDSALGASIPMQPYGIVVDTLTGLEFSISELKECAEIKQKPSKNLLKNTLAYLDKNLGADAMGPLPKFLRFPSDKNLRAYIEANQPAHTKDSIYWEQDTLTDLLKADNPQGRELYKILSSMATSLGVDTSQDRVKEQIGDAKLQIADLFAQSINTLMDQERAAAMQRLKTGFEASGVDIESTVMLLDNLRDSIKRELDLGRGGEKILGG